MIAGANDCSRVFNIVTVRMPRAPAEAGIVMDSRVLAPSALVERIVAGDRSAEAELVERYSRGLRLLICRSSSDRSSVDDIHQDVFRVALQRIRQGEVREPERLNSFLCGVARRLTIDHHRKAAKQPVADDEAARLLLSAEAGPDAMALANERAQIAEEVLSALEIDRQSQILKRFYIADEDKESICRDMGLTGLHFNRVLHRARKRFKELYLRRTEK